MVYAMESRDSRPNRLCYDSVITIVMGFHNKNDKKSRRGKIPHLTLKALRTAPVRGERYRDVTTKHILDLKQQPIYNGMRFPPSGGFFCLKEIDGEWRSYYVLLSLAQVRKLDKGDPQIMEKSRNREITAAEFSRVKGKTNGWGRYIARKARDAGLDLPRKEGQYWLATVEEWENILKTLKIKPRRRQKKNNRRKS